jgi:hypothetical protein
MMDHSFERASLQERLAKCRELAREYQSGETAEMLRDIDAEICERIRRLDSKQFSSRVAALGGSDAAS